MVMLGKNKNQPQEGIVLTEQQKAERMQQVKEEEMKRLQMIADHFLSILKEYKVTPKEIDLVVALATDQINRKIGAADIGTILKL